MLGLSSVFMFALELGGNKYAWDSINIISLFSGFAVLFILFIFAERKASDPVISFSMFKDRLFAGSTIVGLLYGVAFIVGAVFIPIFIQGVTGGLRNKLRTYFIPMMLGVVVSSPRLEQSVLQNLVIEMLCLFSRLYLLLECFC